MNTLFKGRGRIFLESAPLTAASVIQYLGGGVRTSAGVDVSEQNAMRHMAVWRAVNLLSSTVASLPLRIYKDGTGGRVDITDQTPLFSDPAYPDMTWFECLEMVMLWRFLNGNGYALKIWNEGGTKVSRVLPIAAERVSVTRGDATVLNPSGKLFKITGIDGELLTPNELMQIPGPSRDGLMGLSPISWGRQAIGVGLAAEEVAARLFDSGLLNGGVLQAEVDLTDEDAAKAKQRWREKVAGLVRSYEVAIVSNGFKYQPTTIPPKDAQWIEARAFGVQEVSRLYGVPADLLMDNSATGNTNVEARGTSFVRFGLAQELARLERRLSLHLLPRGTYCVFDASGLQRGDVLAESKYFAAAVDKWMTKNEIRDRIGLGPLPGGDVLEPPAPPALAPAAGGQTEEPADGEDPAAEGAAA